VRRWNAAIELVHESTGLSQELSKEVQSLEQLFEVGQADLTRLMQARQRFIQLDTSWLDVVWTATQAQADPSLALGTPTLINAMLNETQRDAPPNTRLPPSTVPAVRAPFCARPVVVPLEAHK
jgi:outer membrane protein, heavy metal efflux system